MKTKILLVDDEVDLKPLFTMRFRHQIQANTYEFVFVRDGYQALAVLEQQPDIDLVLSDINMPGMDGLTLLARLPQINPFVRGILITAYGDMANIRTAMNRGAVDFITKPIDFQDLQVTIDKASRLVSQLRETADLKAVTEMKNRFFTHLVHELRSPLSLIVSPVDKLLETPGLSAAFREQLSTAGRNARQLLRLINQLMDINQLEREQMDRVEEIGDLPDFVGQLVALFRPTAELKALSLTYHTDLVAGSYRFDAGKWEQILYNLLANAIRFTTVGSVSVGLFQTPTGVRLTVRDTGIGITAHKLPHLFDRFYQGDNQRIRAYDSSSIGLALIGQLTRWLGGTIGVSSRVDPAEGESGTEFILDLPVQRLSNAMGESPELIPALVVDPPMVTGMATMAHRPENTPLVLVVEDNAELREFILAELATTYRVRSAADGHQAWVLAKEELPDVIISELLLPRLDGYALLERLRTDPATDHLALILLTADAGQASRLKGLSHGADDYLTKPFQLDELRLRLRNLLGRQQRLREQYRQQLAQPNPATPLQGVADQFLSRLYQLIESRLDDSTLSVEWLTDELAMSRKSLYLKVHNLTHLSPSELIRQYRLRKAIDLLRSGRSISETAYMVGFETPSYFTRVFRDFYQQTPSEYVKR